MAVSKIVITFSTGVNNGDIISFKYKDNSIAVPIDITLSSEWRDVKYAVGHVQRNEVGGLYDELISAFDYRTSFEADYNVPSKFSIISSGNEVTIEGLTNAIEFSDFVSVTGDESAVITNVAYTDPYVIDVQDFFAAQIEDVCSHISVNVETSESTVDIVTPISQVVGNDAFDFEWIRGVTFDLEINNGTDTIIQSVTTPSVLESPSATIVNKPSGATVLLSVNNIDLSLTYSVNGVDYQTSPSFPSMVVGSYTAYVKDQYGCIKTTPFEITAFTPQIEVRTPFFFLSNQNGFRFKHVQEWDYQTIYKTDENTLSYEETRITPQHVIYPFYQKWQTNDIVPTQFLSNYENHAIKTIDGDGNESILLADKKSNNIGLQDKRDARIYDRGDGKTGIYFLSGNIYDYGTTDVSGSYTINDELPEWAIVGRSVYIDEVGGYALLENILWDSNKQRDVLVFTTAYSGLEIDTTVTVDYNLFNWEVYEFDVAMLGYLDKYVQISLIATHDDFATISLLSEWQHTLTLQEGTIEVKYWGEDNNDIIYSTGIKHTLRLDYDSFINAPENEREVHKTDTNVIPLSTDKFSKKELSISRLTTVISEKVMEAFGQENLTLNRQTFTTDSIDTPENIGQTNWYSMKITLYKTKEQQESIYNDVGLVIPEIPEAPVLLDYGSGLLDYGSGLLEVS